MQVIQNPDRKSWKEILQRPYADNTSVLQLVQRILQQVRQDGDKALRELTKKFDSVALESFDISQEEINQAAEKLSSELKAAIQQAKKNIETFHAKQSGGVEVVE